MLSFDTAPSEALVECYRYVDQGGRLVEEHVTNVQTPVNKLKLPMGSYLLIIKKQGYRDTRYPVLIERLEQEVIKEPIPLYTDAQIGEGFIYVPGGESILGGDSKAWRASPRSKKWVDGFLLAEHEVTWGEYQAFLLELIKSGRPDAEIQKMCPRRSTGGAHYWRIQNKRIVNRTSLGMRTPIFGISWQDAKAYCDWRSAQAGREITLPTENEWVRAARGADDRSYTWGGGIAPSWAVMADYSGPEKSEPHDVLSAQVDVSIFGVRDLVGSVQEWCLDSGSYESGRNVRGGAWDYGADLGRIASRGEKPATSSNSRIGFRVRTLPKK
jgi:serine/threonine-protein kinase